MGDGGTQSPMSAAAVGCGVVVVVVQRRGPIRRPLVVSRRVHAMPPASASTTITLVAPVNRWVVRRRRNELPRTDVRSIAVGPDRPVVEVGGLHG